MSAPKPLTTAEVERLSSDKASGLMVDVSILLATTRALEALKAEVACLKKLAYIGEHHFPDLTWKARYAELKTEITRPRKVLDRSEPGPPRGGLGSDEGFDEDDD